MLAACIMCPLSRLFVKASVQRSPISPRVDTLNVLQPGLALPAAHSTDNSSVPQILQEFSNAYASGRFLLSLCSWRNTPVLASPHCTSSFR